MKNYFIISFILLLISLNNLSAENRDLKLEKLFNELKINNSKFASQTEQKIWQIWSTHPSNNELTNMLATGSNFVNDNQLFKAVEIFTKVIDKDPSWAEAWNKRATVLYLMGEFEQSQNDIDKVLELEERHFGALAGQGLVNIQLKNYEKAIRSYEEAMTIYPSMKSPEIMIKQIKKLIKEQSI